MVQRTPQPAQQEEDEGRPLRKPGDGVKATPTRPAAPPSAWAARTNGGRRRGTMQMLRVAARKQRPRGLVPRLKESVESIRAAGQRSPKGSVDSRGPVGAQRREGGGATAAVVVLASEMIAAAAAVHALCSI